MAIGNIMDIAPEKYYFDTVRPLMISVNGKAKFDDVLNVTIEEVMNKADAHAVHKEYTALREDFNPITFVLLDSKSKYTKDKPFITATEEEKNLVLDLGNKVQQLLTIIQCTKEEVTEKETKVKPRLGYDEVKQENIVGGELNE